MRKRQLIIRALLTWLLFMPIAIINGIVREATYKHFVGDLTAHQISTVIASMAFITSAYFMLSESIKNIKVKVLLLIGLLWTIMTITFEFVFGHYVDNVSWRTLLVDYNIFHGRIWSIFLIIIFFTPLFIRIIKRLKLKKYY